MSVDNKHSLILLSCSHDKRHGGRQFKSGARQIFNFLGKNRNDLIQNRRKLFEMLSANSEKRLWSVKDGYRDARTPNKNLVVGPDCDFSHSVENVYLPAYERYDGRFFLQLIKESPNFWVDLPNQPIEMIFVTGLYGMVLWDEPIQDYDCHFSDFIRNGTQKKLREYWCETLTKSLCEFIAKSKESAPIAVIYDLLSEEEYQDVFRWKEIEKQGIEIRHRLFWNSNLDNLSDLGTIVGKELKRFSPKTSEQFDLGQWIELPNCEKIRFEPDILDPIRIALLEQHPFLETAPDRTISAFCNAEKRYENEMKIKDYPISGIIIEFAICIENYLRDRLFQDQRRSIGSMLKDSETKKIHEIEIIKEQLRSLNNLRGQAAHTGGIPDHQGKERVKKARGLAYQIMEKLLLDLIENQS